MTRRYMHLGAPDDPYGFPYCSRSNSNRKTRSLTDVDCPHCRKRWERDSEAVRAEWPRLWRDDLTIEEMDLFAYGW